MSQKEQLKLETVSRVLSGKMKRKIGKKLLKVSEETFRRYCRAYEARGVLFVKHGNFLKTPWNKLSDSFRDSVCKLIQEKYFDVNVMHLQEKLLEEENIKMKRETLRKLMHKMGLMKKAHHRVRKARHRRDRLPQTGMMIQMDGSPHPWFGGVDTCLIAAIDDASSEIHYAEFFPVEDTPSCMKVIQKIVEKRGIFNVLYVDGAGIYNQSKRPEFGQLARACESLGIHPIVALSAEGKGRVERLFQTLQVRLCVEMRLRKIETMEAANEYLQNEFIPNQWSEKFQVLPKENESAFTPYTGHEPLSEIFCLKEWRTIAKDHTISWNAKTYALRAPDGISIARQKIEIRHYWAGGWKAFYRNKAIELIPTDLPVKVFPSYSQVKVFSKAQILKMNRESKRIHGAQSSSR